MPSDDSKVINVEPGVLKQAEVLDTYLGPFTGDVLVQSVRLFPDFSLLRNTNLYIKPDFDMIVGGINSDGEPSVHIGLNNTAISSGVRARIMKRFELPSELDEAPKGLFVPFILAHELGHVMQADSSFVSNFGYMDDTVYSPEDDYAQYVESDHEVNADYIASYVVSHTDLGRQLLHLLPSYPPSMWREWGSAHRVIEL